MKVIAAWREQAGSASRPAGCRFHTVASSMVLGLAAASLGYAQTPPDRGGVRSEAPSLSSREIAEVFSEQPESDAEDSTAVPAAGQGRAAPAEEAAAAVTSEKSSETDEQPSKSSEEIQRLVDQLGSSEFATRERASAELYATGSTALPQLRKVAESATDLEVRRRAQDVADGITSGEVAGRIDEFLAGGPAPAAGWPIVQQIFGDGIRVRELFVELSLRHTEVLDALEGTSRQREEAFENLLTEVKQGMFLKGRLPTGVDAVALLLCVNDPDVAMSNIDEETMLSILRRKGDNQLDRDPQLAKPYLALVGGWVLRSSPMNRVGVLAFTRDQSIPEGLEVAEQTLKTSRDVHARAAALQAVVRFGDESHIELVKPLLQDERVVNNQFFASAGELEVQVRDAAAAALVILHGKTLDAFGINAEAYHPLAGLVLDRLALPKDEPLQRRQVLQKVQELSRSGDDDDQETTSDSQADK